jgi:putative ABC transport system permease protein
MSWLREIVFRLRAVLGMRQRERVLGEELQTHLALLVEQNMGRGMSEEAARREAKLQLGGADQIKESVRDHRGLPLLETLWQDIRYGIRMLVKSPGFTAVAILTLALGIGANTAIFALVKTMLLQPLPVRAGNRLVVIWIDNLKNGWSRIGPSTQDYLDWKMQQKSFEDLFLFQHGTGTITGTGEPEQISGLRVTTNFGDFFGIKPILGRTFRLDEADSPHNLMILSYAYWQRKFGGARNVVGRGLVLNGEPYTIIGVLPPSLSTIFPYDLIVPEDNARLRRGDSDLGVFGRLRRGVTVEQASSEMNLIMQRIARQRPSRKGYGAFLMPLQSARLQGIRPALLLLLCAAGFVLLIACANVANLLLSRSMARQREVAVRMALGAGRVRLLRQFLAESTLLALLGGSAGLLLAVWSNYLLAESLPSRIFVPNAADQISLPKAHFGATTFIFALVISLLTGVIFGLIPAMQSLRCDFNESLKEGKRGSFSGRRAHRSRAALVIAESASAFVLVIGAGLMLKSLSRLLAASPGFEPDHLLTLRIKLPNDAKDSPYRKPRQQRAAFQNFLARIQPLPGVQSAAFAEILPLSQDDMDMGEFVIQDAAPLPPDQHLAANFRDVSPSYFRTMGIPLIQGRAFTGQDDLSHARIVIIDESFARHFFPNEDPIGHRLQVPNASAPAREIVGVVGGVLETGFDQPPLPTIYFPSGQTSDQTMSLVVRTSMPAATVLPEIKNAIWSVDKEQPIFEVRTMDQIIAEITSAERIASWALDVFAFLALALAAIGIYGVTAYTVSQRVHEVGIRMALGAQPADVMSLVLGQGLKLALVGVGAGVLASFGLTRLMSSLLYGVSATDPLTFVGVAVLLVLVALAACYIPGRRALRVDPMVALRYE